MADKVFNVLFLCTGNSARSILGERLIEHLGKGRFRGYSAGSHPKGKVHPVALQTLERNGLSTQGLRSKDWVEFSKKGAPVMDFIFTVCDNAANETCPVWPGKPVSAHWGLQDPAAVEGDEQTVERAFDKTYSELESRIRSFVNLPLESLEKSSLQQKVRQIGQGGR